MHWFSAKLRHGIFVEHEGADTLNETVHIFRAKDFESARERAIDIGFAQETTYLNGESQMVRWHFMEVLLLNIIQVDNLDGAEVHSELIALEERLPIEQAPDPKLSKPGQSF